MVELKGFFLRAEEVSLGAFSKGEGTLTLRPGGFLEADLLIVGADGRGHVEVGEVALIASQTLVLADTTGAFGSMNVAEDGIVRAERVCVGCYEGVGILGVDGELRTDLLQVGPLGSVRGDVIYVRRVTTNKTASKRGEAGVAVEPGIFTGALYLSGEATVEVDSLVVEDGTLGGTVTWLTDFTNSGTLSPGDSAGAAGTLTVDADYAQATTGALEIELGGTGTGEFDVLVVSGTATLAGTLRLALLDGYVPEVGDRFEVVTAGALGGRFGQIELPENVVAEVAYSETVVTVTVTELTSTPVEEPAAELPAAYALSQNYPNPFNPSTRIAFALPEPAEVRLIVYDVLGREVERVAAARYAAGRHEVIFEAGDLPSGIYVYRLHAGGDTLSRSMVVSK